MDACWEADTFCPYLEDNHSHQGHKGKRHSTLHAPEISYVKCNNIVTDNKEVCMSV